MPNKGKQQNSGDLWLGLFFICVTLAVLVLSSSIKSIGLGNNFDPGPKAFPIGLSLLLAAGGVFEFIRRNPARLREEPVRGEAKSVLLLLAAFAVYVILLPWLGFAISTLIMATTMMMILGNPWWSALSLSLVLLTIIYILFVLFFRVHLPSGVFGMPF
ncbi:MAG: tripartite tricarboxylate transporter TctB family protein [Opitutales bacterium]|jgi:hypothetical protein|nr:tripartite tricarboxylate transporter TctB family protein [Opitutales bacterium]